jgi:hypothetical protein
VVRPVLPVHLPDRGMVVLDGVPFHPQVKYQCGPAALATVLEYSGVRIDPTDLVSQVYTPARQGSLQLELVGAVRRNGRIPLKVRADLSALDTALRAGYPVLVLQNLRFDFWPQWHYAVVVAIDPQRDEVTLRSGVKERLVVSGRTFLATWRRAGYWGMIVADPGSIPAFVDLQGWLVAVSSAESVGRLDEAILAYQAGAERWPQSPLPLQALGNARYAKSDLSGAIDAYRAALKVQPLAETHNNLAQSLGQLGCVDAALEQIEKAYEIGAPVWRPVLEATKAELLRMPQRRCEN